MMNCFPCFTSQKSKNSPRNNESNDNDEHGFRPPPVAATKHVEERETEQAPVKTFNFRELATATKNFRQETLLGEGGFGRVYKGTLQSTGQLVAVKQLDKHGMHGNKEFQAEVLSIAKLEHPNLVKLVGYCADGDQRLLVFEYVSGGSLQDHLYEQKASQKPMDWITRMKIAFGAAQGLDYLHDKVNPPVIYRDLKASNILLDDEFYPKLCDFGLHNLEPGTGDSLFLSSRVMDTYGYSAPEYTRGDELTVKSDVYSFGVVMLELITGRRAVDTTKPTEEQNLVAWAQPIFRDPKRYPDMADPLLKKNFSERGLNQAVAITSMCLQEEPTARPLISDVMVALSFLSMSTEDGIPTAVPILSFRDKSMSIALRRHGSCSVTPFSLLKEDEDKASVSSDSDSEHEEEEEAVKEKEEEIRKSMKKQESKVSMKKQESRLSMKKQESRVSMKKQEEAKTATYKDDESSDSDSEKGKKEEHSQVEKPRSSSSSSSSSDSGSEKRRSIDETNATAQSLKIKYSYSSEEEDNNERLSSKNSCDEEEEEEESFSLRFDIERDPVGSPGNTSRRINSLAHDDDHDHTDDEEEEEKNHETQLEHIHSSKSVVQSVYSDDDASEGSGSSSFHQIEAEEEEEEEEEEEHISSDHD
ncbi:unnamed protein product [Microthlaspi erraticum]|uniref:Protein kinase domain-containing protein n=1 Tax=Microthlaspi erraticum TaxID=1685480 RepID=A0A6D2JG29_9BRAS|nr:unnamed protein product [Microthlaspi erraticum]